MTFDMSGGKKFIFYSQGCIDIKFEIKAKKKIRPIFWCTLIQAVELTLLGFFLQNVHLITKYLLPEKLAFSLHYKPLLFGQRAAF